MIPITFETQMNMKIENTSGKNLHAFRAGGASDHAGDEFVTELSHRLNAARNELPSGGAADHQ